MSFILTLSCVDRPGIVATVAGFLAKNQFNIRESAQFGDRETDLFFMRVAFEDTPEIGMKSVRLSDPAPFWKSVLRTFESPTYR